MGNHPFLLALTGVLCTTSVRAAPCSETASVLQSIGETCSNGLPGIDGSSEAGIGVCCPVECGACGGAFCSSINPPNSDCCPNEVVDSDPGDCAETGAAPCVITSEALFPVGDGEAQKVFVTPDSGQDLANIFACEGGEFHVLWSGVVTVPETIYIGRGTTVWVVGSNSSGNSSLGASDDYSSQQGQLEALSTALPPLPSGLTAAAARTATSVEGADTMPAQTGPVFFVDGGQLFLQGLAVLGGYAAGDSVGSSSTSSTSNTSTSASNVGDSVVSGGGVYAIDANVTVTRCEFEDNFADYLGGGIFAQGSTLVVVGSVFRRCHADVVPSSEDVDADGAGGGIGVENSDVLIDGCLFDDCYASNKGGGFHQEDGGVSIINSLFYNSTVGSVNEESEDPIGEGGALSFIDCHQSFDGRGACGVNDTMFAYNDASKKGGAVVIWSKSGPSRVEFHRCSAQSNSAGEGFEDDPQGQGGVFAVGKSTTIVLADCLVENNYAGDRGGMMAMAKGGDLEEGAAATLRNSSFLRNRAGEYHGGVVHTAEFAYLLVEGDQNVFAYNEVTTSGAVFAGVETSTVVVEGGEFFDNKAEKGGVSYSTGNITILGGNFRGNVAEAEGEAQGGVLFGPSGGTISIAGGMFEENRAKDGGAVYVFSGAMLAVGGGEFSGNVAENTGGAISVLEDGELEITGGAFFSNNADFGGFLYKKGAGSVSCTGASAERNQAVDGGGVYAVENATLHWECDLVENSALSGPAIYARENSTVVVRGATLVDNVADTGPVVLIVSSSNLRTYQVVFNDTSDSTDASAVQLDQQSSYKAENACFVGFVGEAIIFSRGALTLDGCDFSGSSASTLVYSEGDTPVVRNAVLGDANYYDDRGRPKAESLVNVNVTCDAWIGEGEDGVGRSSSASSSSPCSDGPCLDGDFGVYCLCYVRESNLEEVCLDGDVEHLNLAVQLEPGVGATTILPDTPENILLLSLGTGSAPSATSTGGSGSGGGGGTVVWTVSGSSASSSGELEDGMMDWTVFPSTGMLFAGQSVELRVATTPSDDFDGLATATFVASGAAQDTTVEVGTSFSVAFFHCHAGEVWKHGESGDSAMSCALCTDVVQDVEGLDCSEPGSTTKALPILPGFWRTTLDSFVIRECLNEDACSGGSSVASVAEYCNEGYEGPRYGAGVANSCHRCSSGIVSGMYFVVAAASLLALALAAMLAVYLVGGTEAVTITISRTRHSVANGLGRSDQNTFGGGVGVLDFGDSARGAARTSPDLCNTGASVDFGGDSVAAGAPREKKARRGRRVLQTIATRVTKVFRSLPLSKLKIVIVVWQISSSFAGITQVPLPSVYERFLGVIRIFSFDLGWVLSAVCVATGLDFFDKLLMVTIGPAALFCFLGVTFCLGLKKHQNSRRMSVAIPEPGGDSSAGSGGETSDTVPEPTTEPPSRRGCLPHPACPRKWARLVPEEAARVESDAEQDRLWSLFARHTTLALIILYLAYTQISTVVFQAHSCEDFPEIGKSYLRADFRIECDTDQHNAYKIYATIMILIYPLGIPAAFCYFLVRQRARINPPVNPGDDKQAIMKKRAADRVIAPTFFLWSPFVPNRYYYEVLECFRRLLLTGLLVFLQPDTPGQIAFGCIFAFISLMVFELLRPHEDQVEKQLYRSGCLLIFFTNFMALTIKAEVASPDSSGSATYAVVLVIANACFFMAAFSNTWFAAKEVMAGPPVMDLVLGISVGEEPLGRSAGEAEQPPPRGTPRGE